MFDLGDGVIAFDAQHLGETAQSIYVTAANSTKFLKLAQGRTPDISSDGSKIVFASTKSENSDIYIMNSDGSNLRPLAVSPGNDAYPRFSGDGLSVVFFSNRSGVSQIYLARVDGKSAAIQITSGQNDKYDPAFSRDGQHIYYNERIDEKMTIQQFNIESGQIKNLSETEFDDIHPSADPEGKRLLFRSNRTAEFQIYQMQISSRKVEMITGDKGSKRHPQYSPDGRYAIFHTVYSPGNAAIQIADLSNRANNFALPRITGAQLNPSWAQSKQLSKFIESHGTAIKCVSPLQKLWSAATDSRLKLRKVLMSMHLFEKICSIN